MDAGDDPDAAAELAVWLAGDRRRVGAYLRAQAIWKRLETPPISAAVPPVAARWRASRRLVIGGAVAAAAAGFGTFWLTSGSAMVVTEVGERRRMTLPDKSIMTLNTASESRFNLTENRRTVELERGEALFQVAKDKTRPFIVSAGSIRVEAVGTAFSVRRRNDGAEVVVTSGTVRAWSERNPTRFLTLHAGHRTYLTDASGADTAKVETDRIDEALAWQHGMIALDGMTLAEAAIEFNRYNQRQIMVDEQLANRRVIGWFEASDPEGFARSAAAVTGARIERDETTVRIIR